MNKEIIKDGDEWGTPIEFFRRLNTQFNFTLDPCANIDNAKCEKFFTREINGLEQDWSGERVFCNPPYSRGNIERWMRKCYTESLKGTLIVVLIPASTSSDWFHKYVLDHAEIHFIKGRIRFTGAKYDAPFSSLIVIYNNYLFT